MADVIDKRDVKIGSILIGYVPGIILGLIFLFGGLFLFFTAPLLVIRILGLLVAELGLAIFAL